MDPAMCNSASRIGVSLPGYRISRHVIPDVVPHGTYQPSPTPTTWANKEDSISTSNPSMSPSGHKPIRISAKGFITLLRSLFSASETSGSVNTFILPPIQHQEVRSTFTDPCLALMDRIQIALNEQHDLKRDLQSRYQAQLELAEGCSLLRTRTIIQPSEIWSRPPPDFSDYHLGKIMQEFERKASLGEVEGGASGDNNSSASVSQTPMSISPDLEQEGVNGFDALSFCESIFNCPVASSAKKEAAKQEAGASKVSIDLRALFFKMPKVEKTRLLSAASITDAKTGAKLSQSTLKHPQAEEDECEDEQEDFDNGKPQKKLKPMGRGRKIWKLYGRRYI